MKTKNFNLGKPLSREEQKQIIGGGIPTCEAGDYVNCDCSGEDMCIPSGNGHPNDICAAYCGGAAVTDICWPDDTCMVS